MLLSCLGTSVRSSVLARRHCSQAAFITCWVGYKHSLNTNDGPRPLTPSCCLSAAPGCHKRAQAGHADLVRRRPNARRVTEICFVWLCFFSTFHSLNLQFLTVVRYSWRMRQLTQRWKRCDLGRAENAFLRITICSSFQEKKGNCACCRNCREAPTDLHIISPCPRP